MIIVYGAPGSGKSVQGQLLAANNDWRWLSTGQLLRDMRDEDVLHEMAVKGLVNNKAVYRVLINAISQAKDVERIVLDGFPRDLEQAQWLVAALPEHQRSIQAVINLQVPFEEISRRLVIRGRFDDEVAMVHRRYDNYLGMVENILDYMREERVPVIEVNGVGDPEEIHHVIEEKIQACLRK
jgi:adenylate kinase